MTAPTPEPEFSRLIDIRKIDGRELELAATSAECAALAKRFSLVSVGSLRARVSLARDGEVVTANGRLMADIVQSCAISAEDLPVHVDEPLALRFLSENAVAPPLSEEEELSADACDEIPFTGDRIELGEALAQSLALSIDPFATGPDAERVRREVGLQDEDLAGPFAKLAALKGKLAD